MSYKSSRRSKAAALLLLAATVAVSWGPAIAVQAAQVRVIEPTASDLTCPASAMVPLDRAVYHQCPPPVSDIKRLRPFRSPPRYPWSHPVRCVRVPSKGGAAPRRGPPPQTTYCLYTAATYGRDSASLSAQDSSFHGVSLITSPETAADLVGADAFEDRASYGGASRKRVFAPGPVGGAYEVRPSAGKGLGVFAARKIAQGEIAMLDLPALLLSRAFLEEVPDAKARRRMVRRALSQLPAGTQAQVFGLSRGLGAARGGKGQGQAGGDDLDTILGTNTISLSLGQNEMHLGLYPELSRVNHACNPNSYYRFSARTLSIELVAYRDIQPNEEVTISYAQLTQSRTERRAFLLDNWHFNCSCSLCRESDPDAVTRSEDRRRDLRKLQATLVSASRSGDYDLALQTAQDLQRTTDEEGVTPLPAEMYDILASIHLDRRNFAQAQRYGQMALAAWERFDSVDDSQLSSARWFLRFAEAARAEDLAERARRAREQAEEEAMEAALDDFF